MGSPVAVDLSAETVGASVLQWVRELLEDPAVELTDNFLDAGGHSMFAVELNERAIQTYAAEFSVEVLYKESLAEAARDLAATAATAARSR